MRRSLLLISISSILFSVSCSQTRQGGKADSTSLVRDTSFIVDSVEVSGTVGMDEGIKKDSIVHTDSPRAIIHYGPEQDKVDSIKKAKLKLKK